LKVLQICLPINEFVKIKIIKKKLLVNITKRLNDLAILYINIDIIDIKTIISSFKFRNTRRNCFV
jgi:hypothetical protein